MVALAVFCIDSALGPDFDFPILTIRHHIIQFLMLVLGPIVVMFAVTSLKAIQSRWLAIFLVGPISFVLAYFIGMIIGMSLDWFGDDL